MNPLNPREFAKLRDSMRYSSTKLRPFRSKYIEYMRQYVGHNYGENGADGLVAVNLIKLAIDIYQRQLSASTPKALILTNNRGLKTHAFEMELALNFLLGEIKFGQTLRDCVKSSLFMMGVIKVGITPSELDEAEGWRHDAGLPFADCVLFDDWIHDVNAKRRDDMSFCGDRYRIPLSEVVDNPMFDKKQRERLRSSTSGSIDSESEFGPTAGEKSSELSVSKGLPADEFMKHVDLWDVWLPRENMVLTFADTDQAAPLRVVEWEGPENGPYHILNMCPVPGNLVPSSPASHLIEMHILLNRLFAKMGDQAERRKTIAFASGPATSDGLAERILESEDGTVLRSDDPSAVREMTLGGVGQEQMGFLIWARDLFSYMAGNLESMGGLSQQGGTLGQERLLKASSNQLINEMQDTVLAYTQDVLGSLGFHLYKDPFLELKLNKKIKGTELEVPFIYSPDRREADYYEFNLKVEPYSLQPRSPGERLEMLMNLATQVLLPMSQQMAQEGGKFRVDEFLSMIGRYSDLPELAELVEFGGEPLDMRGSLGQEKPTQSPVTQRNYTRESGPNEAAAKTNQMQAIQEMMSGASNQG